MNDALHAAASAMSAISNQLDIATKNAVNGSTPGYKSRLLTVRSFATALDRELGRHAALVETRESTAFVQGPVVASENAVSAALKGHGFFAVETPDGTRYTRNGDFELSPEGALQTRAGYKVLGQGGPLQAQVTGPMVSIGKGGILRQGTEEIGTLKVVDFENPQELERVGETLFRAPDGVGEKPSNDTDVVGGMLELPPEPAVSNLVAMIEANRGYEAAQRVISTINRSYERLVRGQ